MLNTDKNTGKRMADQVWRMCVGCRKRDSITVLTRVVLASGRVNALVIDQARRLPGRGAWVHPTSECVGRAVSRKAFGRALRRDGALDTSGLDWLI